LYTQKEKKKDKMPETQNIEWKQTWRDEYLKWICGFANAQGGTIVIGKNVTLQPAAVTHGGLTVTIAEQQNVVQPNPLAEGETVVTQQSIIDVNQDDSRAFVFNPGVSLDDLVRAINEVGAAPGDLMAILEALKEAGAISGQLVVI
jgi:flagellar P-ring protein precursor FlgI